MLLLLLLEQDYTADTPVSPDSGDAAPLPGMVGAAGKGEEVTALKDTAEKLRSIIELEARERGEGGGGDRK